jgi:phage baseplate assembly protein V
MPSDTKDALAELSELTRRLHNVIMIGHIWEVDLPHFQLRVKLEGYHVTGWLPIPGEVAQNYVRWRPLEFGTNVMIACEGGDLRNASIVQIFYGGGRQQAPSDSSTLDIIEFIDGAVLSYDTLTHEMAMTVPPEGLLNITADNAKVNISANDGEIVASSNNGKVEVNANDGRVDVNANNGEINLSANAGHIKCESVNGRIDLLTGGGEINATCLKGFNILGNVQVVGSVTCTGSVNATGNINTAANVNAVQNITAAAHVSDGTRSMSADRDLYNTHVHANNGAAPPNPLQ